MVGAGISGLAAAHFHLRDVNPRARILILDPHDDFGGHAKRNELTVDGRTLIGYGGSQSIDTPSSYRPESTQLFVDVGIDVKRFEEFFDQSYYQRHGATGRAYLFMKESWGRDHLVVRRPGMRMGEIFADAPMAPQARADLAMLYDDPPDWLAGMTQEQKLAELRRHYVGHFIQKHANPHPDAYKFLLRTTGTGIGVQYDQFGALDGASGGTTGLTGIELDRSQGPWYGLARTGQRFWGLDEPYIHHFPDGNAGVARALVRRLIPRALPGSTMEELTTARCDYRRLDRPGNRVRIRLRSTVARVRYRARGLEVAYIQDGELRTVRARGVVMACWNNMIPFVVPEWPAEQKAAAREAVKSPLVYANVALRNWRAWQRLGAQSIRFPEAFWDSAGLDFPVSMGSYRFSGGPDEPIVVHFGLCATKPGIPPTDGAKAGRAELFRYSFANYERSMRDALARALGPSGLDPARDIAAITVNRWPHGYARSYKLPGDAFWPEGPIPADIASRRFGRIAVACNDAVYHGFVDGSIEAAFRAVGELARA